MHTRSRTKSARDIQEINEIYRAAINPPPRRRRRIMSAPHSPHNNNGNQPPQSPPVVPPNPNSPVNPNPNSPARNPLPYLPTALQTALNGADPAGLQALNAYLRAAFRTPPRPPQQQQTTQITVVQSNGEKPKFDPHSQTAVAFLQEVASYFAAQNIQERNYQIVFRSLLNEEGKSWYDNVVHEEVSWEELRQGFVDKYDTWYEKQERERALHARRQGRNEKVAPFIWDMVRLSKMVYPDEEEEITVQRCRQALLPNIRISLGKPSVWTIDSLIQAAEVVMKDLRDLERYNQASTNYNNYGNRGRGQWGYRGYRGNFNYHGGFNRGGSYGNYQGNSYQNQERQSQQQNQEQSQGQQQSASTSSNSNRGSESNGNRGNRGSNNYSNRGSYPSRGRGYSNGYSTRGGRNQNKDLSNVLCYKCHQLGHYAGQCPQRRNVAAMAMGQSTQAQETRNTPQRTDNLNSNGNV